MISERVKTKERKKRREKKLDCHQPIGPLVIRRVNSVGHRRLNYVGHQLLAGDLQSSPAEWLGAISGIEPGWGIF